MSIYIIGAIEQIEIIAAGKAIRRLSRLKKLSGRGKWRKLKGRAKVRLPSGMICLAEVHWYEAHGIGRREMKIKRLFD